MSVQPSPASIAQAAPAAETATAVQVPAGEANITTSAPEAESPIAAGFVIRVGREMPGDFFARRALRRRA